MAEPGCIEPGSLALKSAHNCLLHEENKVMHSSTHFLTFTQEIILIVFLPILGAEIFSIDTLLVYVP